MFFPDFKSLYDIMILYNMYIVYLGIDASEVHIADEFGCIIFCFVLNLRAVCTFII